MSEVGSRVKVFLLVTLSDWGGAPRVVYELATRLPDRYEVIVACAPGGVLVSRLAAAGIRLIPIPELSRTPNPWRDLRVLVRLVRVMREERAAILHAHSTKAGFLGRVAARLAGVPVVVFTAHGWAFGEARPWWARAWLAALERIGGALSTRIICVSRHDHALALRFHTAPADRLTVIHNGMDPAPFGRADGRAIRQTLALGSGPVITFVGRFAAQKDPLTLLEAMRRLPAGTLLMVGEGPLRRRVEREVRTHALEGRVILLEPRPDIPEILAASDVFVLPSRWEGLPLVIIEAMMAGLPVVATRVGGVGELVEDGVTGLLEPPAHPQALADALQRLLADAALRARMGAAGRDRALREFQLDRMVRDTARLYETLLAAAAPASEVPEPSGLSGRRPGHGKIGMP